MQRQADLLEVVGALDAPRRLACLLHRRQQQANQHADDGDDYQQFDQREAAILGRVPRLLRRDQLPSNLRLASELIPRCAPARIICTDGRPLSFLLFES